MSQIDSLLDIMIDSLEKKKKVLVDIVVANTKQSSAIKSGDEQTAFTICVEEKNKLIAELERLDIGFQSTFERVKGELEKNKDQYKTKISALKKLIGDITGLSAQIEAGEARNRNAAINYFNGAKKRVNTVKRSIKVANDYYNIMNRIDPQTDKRFNERK